MLACCNPGSDYQFSLVVFAIVIFCRRGSSSVRHKVSINKLALVRAKKLTGSNPFPGIFFTFHSPLLSERGEGTPTPFPSISRYHEALGS